VGGDVVVSWSGSFQRSPAGAFARSSGGARRRYSKPPTPNWSTVEAIEAYVPIVGFGPFAAGSTMGGSAPTDNLSYQGTWPKVYQSLACAWTYGTDGNPGSETVACQNYVDVPRVVTDSSPANYPAGATAGSPVFTLGNTVMTVSYTYAGNPGVFTAMLSGLLDGTASAVWASLVSQAAALLAAFPVPAGSAPASHCTVYGAAQAAPGYVSVVCSLTVGGFLPWTPFWPVSAAFVGVPASWQLVGYPNSGQPCVPSIAGYPRRYLAPAANGISAYGVACGKSTWVLNGLGEFGVSSPDYRTLYAQPYNPASVAMGAVSYAPGYARPLSYPRTASFSPADVAANVGAYGVLGFFPTAA